MRKMIVRIQADQSGTDKIGLEYVDADIPNFDETSAFGSKPVADAILQMGKGVLVPQIVGEAGKWLYEKLAANKPVSEALELVLKTNKNEDYPIYIEIRSDDADELPWEALRNPGGTFLALDRRWPIGRIASSKDDKTYYFDPPIKIMVVLSATGVDARPEWDVLWEAVSASDVPVRLRVLLSQDDLKQHIDDLKDPAVETSYVTGGIDLENAVSAFGPNIIHFFCHGATEPTPRLLLATRADWLARKSSVQVNPANLASQNQDTRNTWLVTLNCCRGAAPVAQAQSLARKLVVEGFPAAIGMREVVASTDAHIFCGALYNLVLKELNGANIQQEIEICWAKMLYEARGRLAESHANDQPLPDAAAELKEWTLPILYMRRSPFRIRGRSQNLLLSKSETQKKQKQLMLLQQAREAVGANPGTPPEALAVIDNEIDKLEAQLYPVAPPQVLSPVG